MYSEIDNCRRGTASEGQKPDYTGFKNKFKVKKCRGDYSNKIFGRGKKKTRS